MCRFFICAILVLCSLALPVEAASLIHSYNFDTDGMVNDLVGGVDGTLVNGATVSGGTVTFDGIDDEVMFPQQLVPRTGAYSLAVFATLDTAPAGFVAFISQGTFSSTEFPFYVDLDNNGNIRVTDQWATNQPFPGPIGTPVHIAVVVDPGAPSFHNRLYLNGVLAAQVSNAITTTSTGDPTRLGRQFSPNAEYLDGSLDDLHIYSGALTAEEVAALATPIPEPGGGLLGLGLVLLAARLWCRHRP